MWWAQEVGSDANEVYESHSSQSGPLKDSSRALWALW